MSELTVDQALDQYLMLQEKKKQIEKQMEPLKAELSGVAENAGDEDEMGSFLFKVGNYTMKREKRVGTQVDMEAAEELLTAKGLWDECINLVPQIDEDAVMALLFQEKLTQSDIKIIFPEKVTWAFVVVKPKK